MAGAPIMPVDQEIPPSDSRFGAQLPTVHWRTLGIMKINDLTSMGLFGGKTSSGSTDLPPFISRLAGRPALPNSASPLLAILAFAPAHAGGAPAADLFWEIKIPMRDGVRRLFAVELLAERARDVNQAGALFPAAPSFFERPGTGVFQVAALAFFAVPAIELESHKGSAHAKTACTLLHAEFDILCKLILFWR
jgi:hypothetical protein